MTRRPDPPLARTPRLEELLAAVRRRLVLQVWLHGLGVTAAGAAAWLLFAFLADWGLRVPAAVRALHAAALVALVGFLVARHLVRPLRRIPDRAGLAVLVERARPDLRELLVSAAQLQAGRARDGDPALVDEVLRAAEAEAAGLTPAGVLDERPPKRRFLLGAGAVAALLALAATSPLHARIFLDRLFGGGTPWPQRTHLELRVPMAEGAARIERTPELVRVRVARGTDVPVLVRARGVVPQDVTLHFDGGRDVVLSPSGGGTFRTLLRSCQEDLAFHATGGDDDDGLPRVEVEVLQPPDVEGVAIAVEPPEYTGLPPALVFDQDVEVVAGSELSVHVLPSPRGATGVARLLPDDRTVELAPAPFPRAEDDVLDREPGLAFRTAPRGSIGFRFELVDATGLSNPDPGLFRVRVREDQAPDVRLLAPGRTEHETVAGGVVPIRAVVEDDFGVARVTWRVVPHDPSGEAPGDPVAGGTPVTSALEGRSGPGAGAGPGDLPLAVLAQARLEVADLAPEGAAPTLDQRFTLEVLAEDARAPEASVGRSTPVRIRLISADELLRRTQDRLARARLDAGRLAELQREKRARTEELLDALPDAGALEAGDALALHGAAVGQRRVRTDASSLARDLARVAEDVLYARLDEKAGPLLEHLLARQADEVEQGFRTDPWRALARAHAAGELGGAGFAGSLVQLVGLALEVADARAAEAAAELERARGESDPAAARDALARAVELQTASLEGIELLLERLAEWDNFQNVLALTRDILARQKALRDRTRRFAKEK